MAELDTTGLKAPIKVHTNCTVIDVSSGSFPRYIEVRMPGSDGARRGALWNGTPALANDDVVICHEIPNSPVLIIASRDTSEDASTNQVNVTKLVSPDLATDPVISADNSGDVTIAGTGDLYVPDLIVHVGDTDTYAAFTTNQLDMQAGGVVGLTIASTGAVINEGGADYDFRVEGDTDTDLIHTDAGNDRVGIGTATPAEKLDVSGGNVATDQAVQAPTYDLPLLQTNSDGAHFRDNDASYPAGWTESDAAATSRTDSLYSFWYLQGTNSDTSWKYRIQTNTDLEVDLGSGSVAIYVVGPILFKNTTYTADVDYYFGMYRDNGGIDEDTFSRAHFQWDSAGSQWRIRGQVKDSSSGTLYSGSWEVFSLPLNNQIYVGFGINNNASKTGFVYYGPNYAVTTTGATGGAQEFMTRLQSQAPDTALTWGTLWVQFHQSRGAGLSDKILVGSWDRVS